jgi:hypothetical protein
MSDRFNIPPNWMDMFNQFVREGQRWLGSLEETMNNMPPGQRVEVEVEEDVVTDETRSRKPKAHSTYTGPRWEYRVAYVNFKGQISTEGEQILIGRGERRSTFVRRFLDEMGAEGWELSGVSPLGVSENSYFVFKRPATGAPSTGATAKPAEEVSRPKVQVEDTEGDVL